LSRTSTGHRRPNRSPHGVLTKCSTGSAYDSLMITAILIREDLPELRREPRLCVRLGARGFDRGANEHPLTIMNLSASGFLLETDQALPHGSSLIIQMPGGVTKICRTVWHDGSRHGALFSEPLNDIELQDLVLADQTAHSQTVAPGSRSANQIVVAPRAVEDPVDEPAAKLPRAARLLLLLGASSASWGIIGTALWQALG